MNFAGIKYYCTLFLIYIRMYICVILCSVQYHFELTSISFGPSLATRRNEWVSYLISNNKKSNLNTHVCMYIIYAYKHTYSHLTSVFIYNKFAAGFCTVARLISPSSYQPISLWQLTIRSFYTSVQTYRF